MDPIVRLTAPSRMTESKQAISFSCMCEDRRRPFDTLRDLNKVAEHSRSKARIFIFYESYQSPCGSLQDDIEQSHLT